MRNHHRREDLHFEFEGDDFCELAKFFFTLWIGAKHIAVRVKASPYVLCSNISFNISFPFYAEVVLDI